MENKKRISKLAIVLAVCLIISLAANIVLGVMILRINETSDKYLTDPNYAIGRNDSEVIIDDMEEELTEGIPLNVIDLYYSEDLKEQIEVEVEERENHAMIHFYGMISGEKLELFFFELTPDNGGDDFVLGTLQDPSFGDLYVVMHMNEQNPNDWEESEYNTICALQERVNDIIVQFYEDPRFVPNH